MRIVVIGGVAGGMSAAARARRLAETAEIIVLDRGDYASFANCGLPYYLSAEITDVDDLLIQTPASLAAALNLDVRLRHDVTALDPNTKTLTIQTVSGVQHLTYDHLILSPGARAARPPIAGLDHERVRPLRTINDVEHLSNLLDDGARRAVVLGSGFIGLEAAEALAMRGLKVTLVELADQVLPSIEPELAQLLHEELETLDIRVLTGVGAEQVLDSPGNSHPVAVQLNTGEQLPADLVVLATGITPDTEVFAAAGAETDRGYLSTDQFGRTNLPDVWAVGDAVLSTDLVTKARRPIALAGPANRAGRIVAQNIIDQQSQRALPELVSTAIVRVGSLTAASTGANRQALAAANIPFNTVHLHPKDHAGYFPGSTSIHLVAHFHQETGKLLGASAVGQKGVDKRIDVLATALKTGLTAQDLIDLDLSYSPPYGQAKDPVNLLGMIAENTLSGGLELWQGAQIADEAPTGVFIDTRSPAEFAKDRVRGAVNIPHTTLRERIAEVRELVGERRALLICESGVRSHLAHRVLAQHGVPSASLSGGMLTLRPTLQATGIRADWIEEK